MSKFEASNLGTWALGCAPDDFETGVAATAASTGKRMPFGGVAPAIGLAAMAIAWHACSIGTTHASVRRDVVDSP